MSALQKRHLILALLILLAVITFLDRISIAVAGPRIQDELHISQELWGWIVGAFVLAYGLFEIPTGALGDRVGQRKTLTRIVVWWSAFTALTGAATGFRGLLVIRFLFGAGEAGAYPNAAGVIARWFPVKEHARCQGFIWAASRFGGALSPLLIVPLQIAIGWRASFAVLGVMGLVWAALWFGLYRDGTGEDRAGYRHRSLPWSTLWRSKQMRVVFAMYFCYAFGSWFFFGWFPTYLIKGVGFNEKEMGLVSALPFLAGTAGNLVGGVLSDKLVLRWGLRAGRLIPACASLVVSALLLLAMTSTRDKTSIVVLSALGFGIADIMLPIAWAVCLDIGRDYAGVVTATMNTAGQLGGFVCAVVFGYVVQATGSYDIPLRMVAGMVILGAILFSRIDPNICLTDTIASSGPC